MFEDSMKEAFRGAEADPGANVWVNIELRLEKEKAAMLRKRVVRYQLLAAASLLFAISVSFGLYFSGSLTGPQPIVVNQNELPAGVSATSSENDIDAGNLAEKQPAADKDRASAPAKSALTPGTSDGDVPTSIGEGYAQRESAEHPAVVAYVPSRDGDLVTHFGRQPQSRLVLPVDLRIPELDREEPGVDPVQAMLLRLAQREADLREEETKKEEGWESLWTSVGVAAGSFASANAGVSPSPSNAFVALNSSIADSEASASGTSYSMGLNLGARIAERWVIQGGVNLLSQSSEFQATNAVRSGDDEVRFRPASMHSLRDAATDYNGVYDEKLVATAPYDVNNAVQYITIPLQAGYLIVNRDVGIQLNAGVATDIFIMNRISAEGANQVQTEVLSAAENDTFRALNFSGLLGTEISYRFGDHYRIALNPGLRYPFSSVYKSEMDVRSSPLTLDLGLRFRYIFH